jgi:hypothetical protein
MDDKSKVADLLLEKFINEEIMTKSEFQLAIDKIMDRHEANIDSKFHTMEIKMQAMESRFDVQFQNVRSEMQSMESRFDRQFQKIDGRYNWIIGITVTSVIGILGILVKIIPIFPVIAH